MTQQKKDILKSGFEYLLTKIAPKNSNITVHLKNGLKFIVRARSGDKSILKEVWIRNIYDKYDIKIEKGDTVIDVGAHVGFFAVYAAEMTGTGKVYSFEPYIENYKRLEKHKVINDKKNLFIYNKGVSDKEGVQTLYVNSANTGGHSLMRTTDAGAATDIQTIRLGEFCERENIHHIDFLKLDCEGAEFDILFSQEDILNMVSKLIMECHPYNDKTVNDMVGLLERNNFKVIRELNDAATGVEMIYAKRLLHANADN